VFTYSLQIRKGGAVYRTESAFQVKTEIYPLSDIRTKTGILSPDGELLMLPGFEWDGPSGPAIDTASFMESSCVHDFLYGLISNRLLGKQWRGEADKTFRQLSIMNGASKFRAYYAWAAVRLFGWRHV